MNYKSTEFSNLLLNISDEVANVFEVSYDTLKNLRTLQSILVSEKEYKAKNDGVSVDDFDYCQLAMIEDYLNTPEPTLLRKFSIGKCAVSTSSNRRCRDFVDNEEIVRRLADDFITNYIPLSTEDILEINKYVENSLSHLCSFIFFMYSIDDTCCEISESSQDYSINVDIHRYADKNMFDEKDIVTDLFNLRFEHKPNINVLEQYPELEEPFYDIAGPSVEDFELLEDKLTYADIVRVINSNPNDIDTIISEIEKR